MSIREVQIWDAEHGEVLLTLSGHDKIAWFVDWCPQGKRIAAAGIDHTIRIWDASVGYQNSR